MLRITRNRRALKTMLVLPVLALGLVFASPASAASAAQTIKVSEKNFKIVLSAKPKAGAVKFVVVNTSALPHDFQLKGPGLVKKTKVLKAKQRQTITVTLKKGAKYTFWCGVSGHSGLGMKGSFVAA